MNMQLDLPLPELKVMTPAYLIKSTVSQPQSPQVNSLSPRTEVRPNKLLTSRHQRTFPLSLGGRAENFEQIVALRQSLNESLQKQVRKPRRRMQLSVEIPRTQEVPESPVKFPELRLRDIIVESQKTPSLSRSHVSPKSRFRQMEAPKLQSRLTKSKEQETDIIYHYRAVTFGDKLARIQRITERALRELKEIQS